MFWYCFTLGRSERPLSQDSQMSASADHHQPVLTVPAQPRQESNSRIDQTHDQGPNQSNGSTQQTSLPLWSQNSEPQNDVLDNHVPHLGTVDPAVRETFSSMQPSGSMNIVQDGVMTEDLARNLLRLHLHQQHQELQLRQHQARLRVRLQSQNASQSAVQVSLEVLKFPFLFWRLYEWIQQIKKSIHLVTYGKEN